MVEPAPSCKGARDRFRTRNDRDMVEEGRSRTYEPCASTNDYAGRPPGEIESPQLHQLAKQNQGWALLKKGAEITHLPPNVMQSCSTAGKLT